MMLLPIIAPTSPSLMELLAIPLSPKVRGKRLVIRRCVCCWGFSPLQPRRTPCGCRPESGGFKQKAFFNDWIPASAGMTVALVNRRLS